MGYYVNSRGTITLATAVLDEVWETLQVASAENLVDVSAADRLEDWASAADKIAVVVADVLGSTCPPDAFHRSGDASEVELQVWADGKLGEALEVSSRSWPLTAPLGRSKQSARTTPAGGGAGPTG
ncbi:hypothetical protein GS448_25950 [Rhodococcus hoagii]|nr:hypothetical protein [Prescottella equi]